MRIYQPDLWSIIKITTENGSHFRIFASWYGGFANGDSWKINSGITKIVDKDTYYEFHGHSSSVYECGKDSYGISTYGSSVLQSWAKEVDIVLFTKWEADEYIKENLE